MNIKVAAFTVSKKSINSRKRLERVNSLISVSILNSHLNDEISLNLKASIATKVVCFSRLLKCLRAYMTNSVDPVQTATVLGPRCLLLHLKLHNL